MAWAIFKPQHAKGIAEIIQSRSSRITAIVGGTILDDTLRRTLTERLRNDKDIANKLLKVSGALGNTGPKIDFLYMLGVFDKPVRNALYGLSEIRNFFAHNLDASFDSKAKAMFDATRKLTLHKGRRYFPHHIYDENTKTKIEPVTNNRELFIVNLQLGLIALMRDRVGHITWSNKPLTKTALREQKRKWKRLERAKKSRPKKP